MKQDTIFKSTENGLFCDIILTPISTEKGVSMLEHGVYAFKVRTDATKKLVKAAIEALFKVSVREVRVVNAPRKSKVFKGRPYMRSAYKKAYVALEAGQTIDLAAGV